MSYIHQNIIDKIFDMAVLSANEYFDLIYKNRQAETYQEKWLLIFCEFLTIYIVLMTRYAPNFKIDGEELKNLPSYIFTHSFIKLFPKLPEDVLEEFTEKYMIESNRVTHFFYTPFEEIYPNPEINNYDETVMGQFSNRMQNVTLQTNPVYWFASRELATKKFLEILKIT